MLLTDGKWPAVLAAERRVRVARCYLSKLTGKLIEEEQQLSAAVTIGGGTYKATIDTGATTSFISEELADNQTENVAASMQSWRWISLILSGVVD